MNRYTCMMLLVLGPLRVMAQRLDGCPAPGMPPSTLYMLSGGALGEGLRQLAVGSGFYELIAGLNDPRPDARSLSALKLAETANRDTLSTLMKAWLAEQDEWTERLMRHA